MVTCHLFLQIQSLVVLSQWWMNRTLWQANHIAFSLSVTSICAWSCQLHIMEACDGHSETLQIALQHSPQTSQLLPFKLPSSCTSYTFPWYRECLLFYHVDLSAFSSVGHGIIFCILYCVQCTLMRKDFTIVSRKLRIYHSSSTCISLSYPAHKGRKGVTFTFLTVSGSFQPATFLVRQLHRTRRDQHFVCQKLLTSLSGVFVECFGLKGTLKII